MFRVGETYTAPNGQSVLVITNDAPFYYGSVHCPIIGLVTPKDQNKANGVYGYNEKGHYCGMDPKKNPSFAPYNIQSDEPNEDEQKLIAGIREMIRVGGEDDIALTKLIRELKK